MARHNGRSPIPILPYIRASAQPEQIAPYVDEEAIIAAEERHGVQGLLFWFSTILGVLLLGFGGRLAYLAYQSMGVSTALTPAFSRDRGENLLFMLIAPSIGLFMLLGAAAWFAGRVEIARAALTIAVIIFVGLAIGAFAWECSSMGSTAFAMPQVPKAWQMFRLLCSLLATISFPVLCIVGLFATRR